MGTAGMLQPPSESAAVPVAAAPPRPAPPNILRRIAAGLTLLFDGATFGCTLMAITVQKTRLVILFCLATIGLTFTLIRLLRGLEPSQFLSD